MRKSAFKKLLELTTEDLDQIELQFFLRNRDLRFITIPDCMFYVKEKPKVLRNELLNLAQTFSLSSAVILHSLCITPFLGLNGKVSHNSLPKIL